MNALPKGIIFDMDGVLVDSEPYIIKAVTLALAEFGLKITAEDFHPFTGTGEKNCIRGMAENHNFSIDLEEATSRTYDIYLELISGNLKPLPGAKEFIDECKRLRKKIAVATSADIRKAAGNFTELKIPPETFDAIIAGNNVKHTKPAPDIFLLAAEKLALDPKDCLVIEDALSGIQAAKAAGAKCLAITSSFTPQILAGADFYAPDLAHVPAEAVNW
ncbi:MAG: HAD-IA family hydrolase [Planctomycetes bacterium]|nr:HAD-IA family hydrolase [Planctomycetota bacterium]MBU1517775.1 HAD-IA family hydrolase [Planctomycetota bacterium]MBU2458370.1 HAD-IA family hydrolase [Planctomycetota bacterium]MBU2597372.1 HAD-IA family hydrolase [Planctomycetota bacterium]